MKLKGLRDVDILLIRALQGGLVAQNEVETMRPGKMELKEISKGKDAGWIKVKWDFHVRMPDDYDQPTDKANDGGEG